jgi:hypothetical protein
VRGELTRRVYEAAQRGATPEETARAVCREVAVWLAEDAAIFSAMRAPQDGGQMKGGDYAHVSVIQQIADCLDRVGDGGFPS